MQYWRYVDDQHRMDSTMDWSVFKQALRTNNDVEGWHHKLNIKARKGNLQFYLPITLMYILLWSKKTADTDEDDPRGNSKDTDAKGAVPSRASCFKCGRSTQQPSQHASSSEEVRCNLRSRVLDFEHVYYILYILMWNM
jgi:hypothetical protein